MNKAGRKRQWTLQNKNDEKELITDAKKRFKEHKESQDEVMSEMVVTSLKWSQPHYRENLILEVYEGSLQNLS